MWITKLSVLTITVHIKARVQWISFIWGLDSTIKSTVVAIYFANGHIVADPEVKDSLFIIIIISLYYYYYSLL